MPIQIRLPLKEQFDQGLHCLQVQQHRLRVLLHCKPNLFHFRIVTAITFGVQFFRILPSVRVPLRPPVLSEGWWGQADQVVVEFDDILETVVEWSVTPGHLSEALDLDR